MLCGQSCKAKSEYVELRYEYGSSTEKWFQTCFRRIGVLFRREYETTSAERPTDF